MEKKISEYTPIGWREWIMFPDWDYFTIKVKVDTGARTSSLHVVNLKYFEREAKRWVTFEIYPWQKSKEDKIKVSAPVKFFKNVKSSSGCMEKRPVIMAKLKISDKIIETELNLSNRSTMGFRMLLGRAAIKKEFIVLPGRSYLGKKPNSEIRKRNRGVV